MLPHKLKNMNLFNDGVSYMGLVTEVTLPKLSRKTEEYRAGGMAAPVELDMGMEKLELQWKVGGLIMQILRQFGVTTIDGTMLRFAGAYQADKFAIPLPVEVVVRGRHKEIDMGSAKVGDNTEHGINTPLTYYKLSVAGKTEIEIDVLNMICIIDGVDVLAMQRLAIGM